MFYSFISRGLTLFKLLQSLPIFFKQANSRNREIVGNGLLVWVLVKLARYLNHAGRSFFAIMPWGMMYKGVQWRE
ncbi:hypothetical protein HanRHA438_Chr10g0469851 [Helianthus annuus]|nr:hypothetical protein HanRHA438_Chr10g0469851 [Helianthus annuus]